MAGNPPESREKKQGNPLENVIKNPLLSILGKRDSNEMMISEYKKASKEEISALNTNFGLLAQSIEVKLLGDYLKNFKFTSTLQLLSLRSIRRGILNQYSYTKERDEREDEREVSFNESIKTLFSTIKDIFSGSKEDKLEEQKRQSALFKKLESSVVSSIKSVRSAMRELIPKDFMGVLKLAFIVGVAYLLKPFKVFFAGIKGLFGAKSILNLDRLRRIFDTLYNIGFRIGLALKNFFTVIGNYLSTSKYSFLVGFAKTVGELFRDVGSLFGRVGNFFSRVGGFFANIWKVSKPFLSSIGNFFKAVGNIFLRLFPFLKTAIKFAGPLGLIIMAIEGIVGSIRGFLRSDGNFFDKLFSAIRGFFAQIIAGLSFGFLSFEDVMGFFDGVIESLTNFFASIYGFFAFTVPETFDDVVESLTKFFTYIYNFFSNTIPELFQPVTDFVNNKLIPAFEKSYDALVTVFTKTIPDRVRELARTVTLALLRSRLWFIDNVVSYFDEQEARRQRLGVERRIYEVSGQKAIDEEKMSKEREERQESIEQQEEQFRSEQEVYRQSLPQEQLDAIDKQREANVLLLRSVNDLWMSAKDGGLVNEAQEMVRTGLITADEIREFKKERGLTQIGETALMQLIELNRQREEKTQEEKPTTVQTNNIVTNNNQTVTNNDNENASDVRNSLYSTPNVSMA